MTVKIGGQALWSVKYIAPGEPAEEQHRVGQVHKFFWYRPLGQ
jgi:hypothetical protein